MFFREWWDLCLFSQCVISLFFLRSFSYPVEYLNGEEHTATAAIADFLLRVPSTIFGDTFLSSVSQLLSTSAGDPQVGYLSISAALLSSSNISFSDSL